MSLALVEMQIGNPQRAVGLLRDLKRADLSDGTIRRLIPRALMAAEQVEEAIREMEELHVLAAEDLENTYALARAYLGQSRFSEAAPLFEELAEKRPLPETYVLIGRTYRDFDQFERAREALQAALDLNPYVARAHYYLGSIDLLDQGREVLEKAMEHFEAELRVSPQDPLTNLYLGIALVEKRRHEEAVPRLELASRLISGRADAFQFLGRAYLALGHLDEAVVAPFAGVSRSPRSRPSRPWRAAPWISGAGRSRASTSSWPRRCGEAAATRKPRSITTRRSSSPRAPRRALATSWRPISRTRRPTAISALRPGRWSFCQSPDSIPSRKSESSGP